MIKVGVVGCGHLGKFHTQLYAGLKEAELVGVYDVDKELAGELAAKYHCTAFPDLHDLITAVDAASVATPALTHYDVVSELLNSGIHVLVEKPITHDPAQAEALVCLTEEKGLVLQVGHVERFNPAFVALKSECPQTKFIEAHRLTSFGKRGTDVDVILDLMVHDIDLCFSIADSPLDSLDASGVSVASNTLDIVNARLKFKNGCTANLTASRISGKKMRKFRVFQEGAYFSLDFSDPSIEIYQLNPKVGKKEQYMKIEEGGMGVYYRRPEMPEVNALEEELSEFIQSVSTGKQGPTICTAAQGFEVVKTAVMIKESCQ